VIRGAVYGVNLGEEKRGHEQRGRHYALVLSSSSMAWSVATIVPTSRSAQEAVFRPTLELMGLPTRFPHRLQPFEWNSCMT
jgi:mRNA interferase MazF